MPQSRWPLPRSFGTITAMAEKEGEPPSAWLFGGSVAAVDVEEVSLPPQPLNDLWEVTWGGEDGNSQVEWTFVGPTFDYISDDGMGNAVDYTTSLDRGYGFTSDEFLWPSSRSGHAAWADERGHLFIFGGVGQRFGRTETSDNLVNEDSDDPHDAFPTTTSGCGCSLLSDLWGLVPKRSKMNRPISTDCETGYVDPITGSCNRPPATKAFAAPPGGAGSIPSRIFLKLQEPTPSPWAGVAGKSASVRTADGDGPWPWTPDQVGRLANAGLQPAFAQNNPSGLEESRWAIMGGMSLSMIATGDATPLPDGMWLSAGTDSGWMLSRFSALAWTDGRSAFLYGGVGRMKTKQTSALGQFRHDDPNGPSIQEVSCWAGGIRSASSNTTTLDDLWRFDIDKMGAWLDQDRHPELGLPQVSVQFPTRLEMPQSSGTRANAVVWNHPSAASVATFYGGAGVTDDSAKDLNRTQEEQDLDDLINAASTELVYHGNGYTSGFDWNETSREWTWNAVAVDCDRETDVHCSPDRTDNASDVYWALRQAVNRARKADAAKALAERQATEAFCHHPSYVAVGSWCQTHPTHCGCPSTPACPKNGEILDACAECKRYLYASCRLERCADTQVCSATQDKTENIVWDPSYFNSTAERARAQRAKFDHSAKKDDAGENMRRALKPGGLVLDGHAKVGLADPMRVRPHGSMCRDDPANPDTWNICTVTADSSARISRRRGCSDDEYNELSPGRCCDVANADVCAAVVDLSTGTECESMIGRDGMLTACVYTASQTGNGGNTGTGTGPSCDPVDPGSCFMTSGDDGDCCGYTAAIPEDLMGGGGHQYAWTDNEYTCPLRHLDNRDMCPFDGKDAASKGQAAKAASAALSGEFAARYAGEFADRACGHVLWDDVWSVGR